MTNKISEIAKNRIIPNIELKLNEFKENRPREWEEFTDRVYKNWDTLFIGFMELFSNRIDLYFHLESTILALGEAYFSRDRALTELDMKRYYNPGWFQENSMVGGALYVDLFSENLWKLKDQIEYFKELGITYIHLMPLFAVRPGNNDGGYAVSNYRSINPELGTLSDLRELARELHESGIILVLDFIFNHTSDDHLWAQYAKSGDERYKDYYYMFPDREIPDRYEKELREIFPAIRRGNFTWIDEVNNWVWTTFNSFQWDLNYSNPEVFTSMLKEMLFIINNGVDVLRLDAVAFIWKEMGTNCENLPQAHTLIKLFNLSVKIVAPGVLFKSEAIVHPDLVIKYISQDECQLSYNPLLMALLWESLATRRTTLLQKSISHRHPLPKGCSWCNYLRCHDDIGWTFDDNEAWDLGINPQDHRKFLNSFYTGQFEGSFARGIPFQENISNGDMRISGTLASLAGLEEALESNDNLKIEMAIKRIMLLHSVILSIGGIPLLYLGEEWGLLNDYDYINDPAKAGDSRWIHRPKIKWEYLADLNDKTEIHHKIFNNIKSLIKTRKETVAFSENESEIVDLHNPHTLGYIRTFQGSRVFVICNFSDTATSVSGNRIRTLGLSKKYINLIDNREIKILDDFNLKAYEFYWLVRA